MRKNAKGYFGHVADLKPLLLKVKNDKVFITNSGCDPTIIEMVKEQLEQLDYFEKIYITRAGSVISSHCGPGTLGVLFVERQ